MARRGGSILTDHPATGDGSAAATGPVARWRRVRRPSRRTALLAAVALIAAGVWWVRRDDGAPPITRAEIAAKTNDAIAKAFEEQAKQPDAAAVVYQTILPSVVLIETDNAPADAAATGEDAGLGSGVVISQEGAIITANHVIADARRIQVVFADGTRANGKVVSAEPENDIAVLATDALPEVVVPAVMGGGAQVGDAVFAFGHPLGLTQSLTAGVVSGLDRAVPLREGGPELQGLIQFDAAVNPGNSGGPLLNKAGQVIGIVTALANPSKQGYFIGVGFAVPIGTAGGAAGGPSQ